MAYENLERFAALIRPLQTAEWEHTNVPVEIVSVTGHPQLHRSGPANGQPGNKSLPPAGDAADADQTDVLSAE